MNELEKWVFHGFDNVGCRVEPDGSTNLQFCAGDKQILVLILLQFCLLIEAFPQLLSIHGLLGDDKLAQLHVFDLSQKMLRVHCISACLVWLQIDQHMIIGAVNLQMLEVAE